MTQRVASFLSRLSINSPEVFSADYLRDDLSGDGKPDTAIPVKNKESGKVRNRYLSWSKEQGILCLRRDAIENNGDDFSRLDIWQVYPKAGARRPVSSSFDKLGII